MFEQRQHSGLASGIVTSVSVHGINSLITKINFYENNVFYLAMNIAVVMVVV